MSPEVSFVIPSKNERFLRNTILDVLEHAETDIEVFPVLDGYSPPKEEMVVDPRVRYIRMEPTAYSKKRHGINKAIREFSTGKYVCWMDGHVMVDKGFDRKLIADYQPGMVLVPRRKRLDPFNWTEQIQDHRKPHIDYEHFLWKGMMDKGLHGFRWDSLSNDRKDIPVDDIMTCQGSFFFMARDWYDACGFMDLRYQGWGQESEEIVMSSILNGGRACVTKNTWYSHWHKSTAGRGYFLSKAENLRSYEYSWNKWVVENRDFFVRHINNFPPQPNWPLDWERQLYEGHA